MCVRGGKAVVVIVLLLADTGDDLDAEALDGPPRSHDHFSHTPITSFISHL